MLVSRTRRPMGAQGHYKGRKPIYSRKQYESAQAILGKSASVGDGSTGRLRAKRFTASRMILPPESQIACQTEKPIAASLPAIVDRHIPALDIPDFTQALMERPQGDGIPVSQNPAR